MKDDIKGALVGIMNANGGRLNADDVIASARQKISPLHDCFEWDQAKAAMETWRETARQLIRNVRVVITNEHVTIRAPYFVRDPRASHKEQGYVAITSVRSESDDAREVLIDEFGRAASALRRAKEVAKALDMEGDVESLLHGVVDLRERVAA